MSDRPPPSSLPMPPQPQSFRFWLPYRSNVGSWRQQPRAPSSPSPQPPPPPPTPAAPAPHSSPPRVVVADIPVQAESSDESEEIPVQLRGARRSSRYDLELTLSGAPPTGQEQSSGRDANRGNDTKIAISGFPRSRLFDGARAPYRQEIEDGLKTLAGREPPAPRPDSGQGYRVITLAGHNVGASMVIGNGGPTHAPPPGAAEPEAARPPAVAANVNSNVQTVNNSSIEGSTCSAGSPGVHVDIKNAREEPPVVAPTPREETKTKEPAKRPPLVVTPQEKSTAPSGGETAARTPATRRRRCLRALMMENGSDTEAARKPRPSACRFQCVADHTPPATANSAGGKDAEDGLAGNNQNKQDKS
ncbi:hypothetical protein ACP70R_006568 [Stipagrostis hirtigluma subsp. patula]